MCYAPDSKDSPAVKYIRVGYMQAYESASRNDYMYHAKCGEKEYRRNTMARLSSITGLPRDIIATAMNGTILHDGKEWTLWLEKH